MIGIGTIINVIAIVLGGFIGLFSQSFFKERYKESIIKISGIAIICMAFTGIVTKMIQVVSNGLTSRGELLLIVSLIIGTLIGEIINIEKWLCKIWYFFKTA